MAVHACPACCVALSASVLWPLRPVASELTRMVAFSTVRLAVLGEWLQVWEGTRGRKTHTALGDRFLGNAPNPKTENGKNGKTEKTEKTEKKEKTENSEKGPDPPNLLVFPVFGCWRGIAKGLGGDEKKKFCGNNAETMRRGGARARDAPHFKVLSA